MHKEALKIDFDNKSITGVFRALEFKDGEHCVMYLPSINISGYGGSFEEARNMVDHAVSAYFENLMSLKKSLITKEIKDLGFKVSQYFKKRYERSFVDGDGVLQNFDIPPDTVVKDNLVLF